MSGIVRSSIRRRTGVVRHHCKLRQTYTWLQQTEQSQRLRLDQAMPSRPKLVQIQRYIRYLDHAPATAKPVSQEPYSQLSQDNAHHLEVVCGLRPHLTALCVPATHFATPQHSTETAMLAFMML